MTTKNEGTQRDELARDLFIADNSNQPREASLVDWEWFEARGNQRGQIEHYKNMAAGMIAAGYRKPRILGYAVVGLTGRLFGWDSGYLTREAAQAAADSENAELGPEGEEPFYRVAEIAEATR